MSKSRLNVVVICCDTLRADVVDHTWEDRVAMPNLDRLRAESTNFTRGFISHDYIRGQEMDRVRSGPLSKIDLRPHLHPDEKDLKRHTGLTQYLLNMLDRKSEEDYLAPRVFRSAERWIDDNTEQKPFFLWIESLTPHEFWDPPKQFADA